MKKEIVIVILVVLAIIAVGLYYLGDEKKDLEVRKRPAAERKPPSRLDKFIAKPTPDEPKRKQPAPVPFPELVTPDGASPEAEIGTPPPDFAPIGGPGEGGPPPGSGGPSEKGGPEPVAEFPKARMRSPMDLVGPGAEHGVQVIEDADEQAEEMDERLTDEEILEDGFPEEDVEDAEELPEGEEEVGEEYLLDDPEAQDY